MTTHFIFDVKFAAQSIRAVIPSKYKQEMQIITHFIFDAKCCSIPEPTFPNACSNYPKMTCRFASLV